MVVVVAALSTAIATALPRIPSAPLPPTPTLLPTRLWSADELAAAAGEFCVTRESTRQTVCRRTRRVVSQTIHPASFRRATASCAKNRSSDRPSVRPSASATSTAAATAAAAAAAVAAA